MFKKFSQIPDINTYPCMYKIKKMKLEQETIGLKGLAQRYSKGVSAKICFYSLMGDMSPAAIVLSMECTFQLRILLWD